MWNIVIVVVITSFMCKKSLTSKLTTKSNATGGRCSANGSYDTFVRTANNTFFDLKINFNCFFYNLK